MKTILFLLIMALPAFARIGESEAQCAKRYGRPSELENYGRAKSELFQKDSFDLYITFLDGVAVSVRFRHPKSDVGAFVDMSSQEIVEILDRNSGGKTWKKNDEITCPSWSRDGFTAHQDSDIHGDYLDIWMNTPMDEAQQIMQAARAKKSTARL